MVGGRGPKAPNRSGFGGVSGLILPCLIFRSYITRFIKSLKSALSSHIFKICWRRTPEQLRHLPNRVQFLQFLGQGLHIVSANLSQALALSPLSTSTSSYNSTFSLLTGSGTPSFSPSNPSCPEGPLRLTLWRASMTSRSTLPRS